MIMEIVYDLLRLLRIRLREKITRKDLSKEMPKSSFVDERSDYYEADRIR